MESEEPAHSKTPLSRETLNDISEVIVAVLVAFKKDIKLAAVSRSALHRGVEGEKLTISRTVQHNEPCVHRNTPMSCLELNRVAVSTESVICFVDMNLVMGVVGQGP